DHNLFEPFEGEEIEKKIQVTCLECGETKALSKITVTFPKESSVVGKNITYLKQVIYWLPLGFSLRINPKQDTSISTLSVGSCLKGRGSGSFEISLENVRVDSFELSVADMKLKGFLDRMILFIKNADVHINVNPISVGPAIDQPEYTLFHGGIASIWDDLLRELQILGIEGNVRFSNNENVNYEVLELLNGHFLKMGKIRSAEYVYKNLLDSYKKLEDTSWTNKFIIKVRSLISDHRTSIWRPLGGILGMVILLLFISCLCESKYMLLLFPGAVFRFESLSTGSPWLVLLIWLQQVMIFALYFEVVVMFKKFAKKK
ncbi:MAG: hypothetical protein OXM61_06285, partial [Candidatus Poribacteria bacterium]|nr:hypothetical protein [Candidatus Poribacteria bacterium]